MGGKVEGFRLKRLQTGFSLLDLMYLNLKILIATLCKRLRRDGKIKLDAGVWISFLCIKTNGWQDGFK